MNLKTVNLKKKYIRNGQEFYAVNGVNIELQNKEFVGLVGHSGCGKSTLLNMIAGILKPAEGEIFINDINILNQNEKQLANMRQQVMAYILQGYNLLSNFTILENVCMPLYLAGIKMWMLVLLLGFWTLLV